MSLSKTMPLDEYHISKRVLDHFTVVGINYSKADTATRGLFSVTQESFIDLAESAKQQNIRSVFVVSTCNRTEIYGIVESPMELADLLVEHTNGSSNDLYEFGYFRNGDYALDHLFSVAAGLDSQILGDYEILGQIRRSVDHSRKLGLIGPVMDRILNFVYQASKKVKTETDLSNGTVSVSFAAIELLNERPRLSNAKVLVIGAGKFSVNVCKNLNIYLPGARLTVVNRTDEKARLLAEETSIESDLYANLENQIRENEVIIVCTNATTPTILPAFFEGVGDKLILDLSVPANVHPEVKNLKGVEVIDVDEISKQILDTTLTKRQAEVPEALAIIEQYKEDFLAWLKDYHYVLHLKEWKNKLTAIDASAGACEFYENHELIDDTERVDRARKAVKRLALNLKSGKDRGCQFINLINDYLSA